MYASLKNHGDGRQVSVDFQENQKAAQEHIKNPMVMSKIQKLVTAGIVQIRINKARIKF